MAETPYPDLPPVPHSFQETRDTGFFMPSTPIDYIPAPEPPQYYTSAPELSVPAVLNEDHSQRNVPGPYLSIIYDPTASDGPAVQVVAGLLVAYHPLDDGWNMVVTTRVIPTGATTPGTLFPLTPAITAPIKNPTAWYLHIPKNLAYETPNITIDTSPTKDGDAYAIKLAQTMGTGTNGRIQQLYAGVVHLPSIPSTVVPTTSLYTLEEKAIEATASSNAAGLSTILKRDGAEVGRSEFKITSTGGTVKITSSST